MKKLLLIFFLTLNQSVYSEEISLEAHKGKVIYLDFWASWCGPCKKSFPWMNELKRKYGDKNFQIIAINLDKEKKLAEEFLQQNKADFSIVYDPEAINAKKYKVKGMPSSYLINQNGKIVKTNIGFRDEETKTIEMEIKKLLSEGGK